MFVDGNLVSALPPLIDLDKHVEVMVFKPGFRPVVVDMSTDDATVLPPSPMPLRPTGPYQPNQRMPLHDRIEAWRVTRAAYAAATLGDCELVKALERQLYLLDPVLHRRVFIRGLAIARCLTTPATTITAPYGAS